jgi:hypothetical protein
MVQEIAGQLEFLPIIKFEDKVVARNVEQIFFQPGTAAAADPLNPYLVLHS